MQKEHCAVGARFQIWLVKLSSPDVAGRAPLALKTLRLKWGVVEIGCTHQCSEQGENRSWVSASVGLSQLPVPTGFLCPALGCTRIYLETVVPGMALWAWLCGGAHHCLPSALECWHVCAEATATLFLSRDCFCAQRWSSQCPQDRRGPSHPESFVFAVWQVSGALSWLLCHL